MVGWGGGIVVAGRGGHTPCLYICMEGGTVGHRLVYTGCPTQGMGGIMAHGSTGCCKCLSRGAQGEGVLRRTSGGRCKVGRVHGGPPCC